MFTIKAKELSPQAFKKYGVYQNLLDDKSLGETSIIPAGFFADVVTLDFGGSTLPTISVCSVKKSEKNIVASLEAHQYTCEGLLPLDGDVIIFVGVPFGANGKFSAENLEAFIIPRGTFVKLNPLIVHGTQYPVNTDAAHIVCMLPGRTFKNDIIMQRLDENERAEIVL